MAIYVPRAEGGLNCLFPRTQYSNQLAPTNFLRIDRSPFPYVSRAMGACVVSGRVIELLCLLNMVLLLKQLAVIGPRLSEYHWNLIPRVDLGVHKDLGDFSQNNKHMFFD